MDYGLSKTRPWGGKNHPYRISLREEGSSHTDRETPDFLPPPPTQGPHGPSES
jgi:hypothetical protein